MSNVTGTKTKKRRCARALCNRPCDRRPADKHFCSTRCMAAQQVADEAATLVKAIGSSELTDELAAQAYALNKACTEYQRVEGLLRQQAFAVGFTSDSWTALKVGKRLYPEAVAG